MSVPPLALPPDPSSVKAARAFVMNNLAPSAPPGQREDACLLVSELVTNAVLHARSAVEVTVRTFVDAIRVEVRDEGPGLPQVLGGVDETMAGRGLHIVEELATRWGVEPVAEGGKVVWFEVGGD